MCTDEAQRAAFLDGLCELAERGGHASSWRCGPTTTGPVRPIGASPTRCRARTCCSGPTEDELRRIVTVTRVGRRPDLEDGLADDIVDDVIGEAAPFR